MDFRLLGGVAFASALLLTSCGSQSGPPQFVQAFGEIESPCAIGASPSNVTQHCVADVLIENQGGEGYGHLTMVVQLKNEKSGTAPAPPVKCGSSIPDLATGGYADLTCAFDLAPGQSVANYPIVQSIDYAGTSSRGSSGSDPTGIAALILTMATALIALASLIVIGTTRRRPSVDDAKAVPAEAPAQSATSQTPRSAARARRRPSRPSSPDAEYDLPQLPR
jgi:hypothetical protein